MKFLNISFVTLGVIFFILLIGVASVFIFSSVSGSTFPSTNQMSATEHTSNESATSETNTAASADTHPLLSESQEKALATFGIDPRTVPSSISPAQEKCFIEKLGAEKVEEIKKGAAPSAADIFMARDCVQI